MKTSSPGFTAITGTVVLSLAIYFYLFFFPFTEGISSAPWQIRVLKDVFIFAAIAYYGREYLKNYLVLAVGLGLFAALAISFAFQPSSYALELKNLLLPLLLAFLIALRHPLAIVMPIFTWTMALQFFPSLLLNGFLHLGWLDHSFIGGIGNPNSFALLCNLAIVWVLATEKQWKWQQIFLLVLLSLNVLFSQSNSQILFLMLLFTAMTIYYRRQLLKATALLISGIGALPLATWFLFPHSFRIIVSAVLEMINSYWATDLGIYLQKLFYIDSISISTRAHYWDYFKNFITTAPAKDILMGRGGEFVHFDSQFLSFAINYGIPVGICFIFVLLFLQIQIVRRYRREQKSADFFLGISLCLFIFTFLFSRILHYFPDNLYFYLIAIYSLDDQYRSFSKKEALS